MGPRGRWVRAGVLALLVGLVVGRWGAVTFVDRAWAVAMGIGATHAQIVELRLSLVLSAFAGASAWCLGNLYVLYRSIGSVYVPRRLGNLEFVEAVPPRYLLLIVVLIGLALALALSYQANDWWHARALADGWQPVGQTDPLLGRDIGYYLFALPWQRTLHSFVTISAGVVLGATAVLYAAVGAVRWSNRRLHVMDTARLHLGGLFCVFALALFWGYRLEPVEYVAGIHDVPIDGVLLDVRFPAARLLSSLALVVAGASVLWIWTNRTALVAVSWAVLAIVSFAGHYVVPAFAAAVRPTEQLALPDLQRAQRELRGLAYGIPTRESVVRLGSVPEPRALGTHRRELERAPVWDAFALTVHLNRAATETPSERFHGTALAAYPAADGVLVPLYIAARQIDLGAAGERRPATTWEQIHAGQLGAAMGVVAVQAHTSSRGAPLYVPSVAHPESAQSTPTTVALARHDITFGPATTDFLLVPADSNRFTGVRIGGLMARIGFALVLQSPKLLTSDVVNRSTFLLWHRAVPGRLERYAPFARFGNPYPVVVDGRLLWLAAGYVASEGFPLAPAVEWRGRRARSLRSGFIGIVDAHSGETAVYLARDPDPVSAAWGRLTPGIVRPAEELPPGVARHVRYPEELFREQAQLLKDESGGETIASSALGARPAGRTRAEAFWWLGSGTLDPTPRLRIATAIEDGDAPALVAWLEATSDRGLHQLAVVRVRGAGASVTPSEGVRLLGDLRPDTKVMSGTLRSRLLPEGVVAFQTSYTMPGDGEEPPRIADVGIAWGGVAARGPTTADAVRRVQLLTPPPRQASEDWVEARRWFDRMDGALKAGDWTRFGRAYEELRRVLAPPDTAP